MAAPALLKKDAEIAQSVFLRIADKPSRHAAEVELRLKERFTGFTSLGFTAEQIKDVDLFAPHADIVSIIDDFIKNSEGSLALDITCLPKRFFFPVIRRALSAEHVGKLENLVVLYAIPREYTKGNLAENFNDWAHLPLFSGSYSSSSSEMLVVGVGFQALGLHEHLKGESGLPIKLLLPFPAPLPSFLRSLELRRQLQRFGSPEMFSEFRAGARDASDTFDRLYSLSRSGQARIALAPFGPKPMSLGMCLFSTIYDCEVFYTQPSVYHPDYSIGTSLVDGAPEVYAYCIRIGGRDFFT